MLIVEKFWSLNLQEPQRPVQACNGKALPLRFIIAQYGRKPKCPNGILHLRSSPEIKSWFCSKFGDVSQDSVSRGKVSLERNVKMFQLFYFDHEKGHILTKCLKNMKHDKKWQPKEKTLPVELQAGYQEHRLCCPEQVTMHWYLKTT